MVKYFFSKNSFESLRLDNLNRSLLKKLNLRMNLHRKIHRIIYNIKNAYNCNHLTCPFEQILRHTYGKTPDKENFIYHFLRLGRLGILDTQFMFLSFSQL